MPLPNECAFSDHLGVGLLVTQQIMRPTSTQLTQMRRLADKYEADPGFLSELSLLLVQPGAQAAFCGPLDLHLAMPPR